MRDKVRKILAVIAAFILVVASVPIYNIVVYAEDTKVDINISVTVKDPEGNKICPTNQGETWVGGADITIKPKDVNGKVSNLTVGYDSASKSYNIQAEIVTKTSDDVDPEYSIQAEYNNHIQSVDYVSSTQKYEIKYEVTQLKIDDSNENYKGGIYTEVYNPSKTMTPLGVTNYQEELQYEISEEEDNTCGASVENGVIKYNKLGKATIIVKPKEGDAFYSEISYSINVTNKLSTKDIVSNGEVSYENGITKYTFKWTGAKGSAESKSVSLDDLINKAYEEDTVSYSLENQDKVSLDMSNNILSWTGANAYATINATAQSGAELQFKIAVSRRDISLTVEYEDLDGSKVLSNNGTMNLSYADYYNGKTSKLKYICTPSDGYEGEQVGVKITYSKEGIIEIDNAGKLNVKGVGSTTANFTVEDENYNSTTFSYTFTVTSVNATPHVMVGDDDYTNNTTAYEIGEDKITDDKISKWWTLRYDGLLTPGDADTLKPEYSCSDSTLTINKNTGEITNTDNIERNKNYTITIKWSNNKYELTQVTYTFYLKGVNSYNENIKFSSMNVADPSNPTEEEAKSPFIQENDSRDGNKWVTVNEIYVYSNTLMFDSTNEFLNSQNSFGITNLTECEGNKEHTYYSIDSETKSKKQREYFGVDLEEPKVNSVTYSGNIKINADNRFATASGDWKVTVDCADNFFYGVELYDNNVLLTGVTTNEISSSGNRHKVELTVPKSFESSSNLEIRVYEKSGRYTPVTIGNFVQDKGELTTIEDITFNTNGVTTYVSGDNLYVSGDVTFSTKVQNTKSGIKSVKTKINGVEVTSEGSHKEFSLNGEDSSRMLTPVSISCSTEGFSSSGKCEIEIIATDNYDHEKKITKTIYIDKAAPTAESVVMKASNNKVNNTSYGNFYNDMVKVDLSVADSGSGAASARMVISGAVDYTYTSQVSSGVATFSVPVGIEGNISFFIKDNVGNENNVAVNLANVGSSYRSNYIVTEKESTAISVSPQRKADIGIWYNSEVVCDVVVSETGIVSGVKSVEILVNGNRYLYDDSSDSIVNSKSYSVNFNNSYIQQFINQDGLYNIQVKTVDNAGNEASVEKQIYIDTLSPVISEITGPADGASYSEDVNISFNVSETAYNESGNKTTVEVTRTLDDTSVNDSIEFNTTDNSSDKVYRFTEDGTYKVSISAVDNAGNKSNTRAISFTIDKTAPAVNVTGVAQDVYYDRPVTLGLNVVESNYGDSTVTITAVRVNDNVTSNVELEVFTSTAKSTDKNYTFAEDGTYTVTVNAVDRAGNRAVEQTYTFTVDNTIPDVNITGIDSKAKNIEPVISVTDDYFDSYSVSLYKRGITLSGRTVATPTGLLNVTDKFAKNVVTSDKGVTVSFSAFEKNQDIDGLYTLVVESADKSGNRHPESYTFVVNRFGSVYTFNSELDNYIKNSYIKKIDSDLVITEYNSDVLAKDSATVKITRDGSPLGSVDYVAPQITESGALNSDSDWNSYEYTIKSSNFALDGVYEVIVSSTDNENNVSENINYDEMVIKFSVDSTAPSLVSVSGLDSSSINSNKQTVNYNVFDAIGLAKVIVYNGDEVISEISEFDDNINYTGTFELEEGSYRNIGFYLEDLAGNKTDSRNSDDSVNVAPFNSNVTISTNFFVRLYNNKPVFYATVGGGTATVAGGGGALAFFLRKRKLLAAAKAVIK